MTSRVTIRYGTAGFGDILQSIQILPQFVAQYDQVAVVVREELQELVQYSLSGHKKFIVTSSFEYGAFDEREHFPTKDEIQLAQPHGNQFLFVPRSLHTTGPELNVGFAWATAEEQLHISDRATSPEIIIEPLLTIPDVTLHHIQVGRAEQLTPWPQVRDYNFKTFAQSARIVDQLDCVVTVDTALAHLAAGLGIPTYVLLSGRSASRFYTHGEKITPWYKAMVLAQTRGGPKTERDPNQLADAVTQVMKYVIGL